LCEARVTAIGRSDAQTANRTEKFQSIFLSREYPFTRQTFAKLFNRKNGTSKGKKDPRIRNSGIRGPSEGINAGDALLVSLLQFIINRIHNTDNATINLSPIALIPQLEINYPRAIALPHRIQDASPANSPARVMMKY